MKRLIEDELPIAQINAESAREKSLRHGNISTMHLWWARRTLAQSRAIVAGTLIEDPESPSEREELLGCIAFGSRFEASNETRYLAPLRSAILRSNGGQPPKVLDCFAGGGAIPLEALRVGCDTTATDLNPVACLIQKSVLEFPQRFGQAGDLGENSLADDFTTWVQWVGERVKTNLAQVFPTDADGRRPAVYFWARTIRCPNSACRAEIPLLRERWLANNTRNIAWIAIQAEPGHVGLTVRTDSPPPATDPSTRTVRASSVACPGCGTTASAKEVREYARRVGFGRRLYAVLDVHRGQRTYRMPTTTEMEGAERAAAFLGDLEELDDGTTPIPDEGMVKSQYRRFSNIVYGIDTWARLFNERQLYVLGSLCAAVREAHATMLAEGMELERAVALTTYLGLCVDRVADRNSSFCSWDWKAINVRNTFPQQAIRMAWNYTEIDPLGAISGSWGSAARWIELAIRQCSAGGRVPARVRRADAQALPFSDGEFDAVIIDPPYYDAFQYGDLSDFFYVWLKRSVGHLYPTLFATPLTPKQQEVIESRADKKSPEYISHEDFERRLQRALKEVARVVKPDGVVAIVFAHTDVEAWERLLRGLQTAGLVVSTSWPMRSELANRPTAQISAVLDSSVVLICRPASHGRTGFYDDVVRSLESRISERLDSFEHMGLTGADYFVSAVGPAFEVSPAMTVL